MCVKNLCKQTVLVQLVIENVVTCFYWNTVYACLLSFRLRFSPLYPPLSFAARGVATGGMSVYIPPQISNCFVHVWDINTCFEIAMTS